MSSSDALWLNVWESVATIGFVIVIIGVVIEGVEHFKKFPRKEHARKVQIEKLGWFLVVAGLAMEFLGDHAAKRISDQETARLTTIGEKAKESAAQAIEAAEKAKTERALVEKQVEEFRLTNLVLQATVLKLESAARDRRIAPEQHTNLVEILRRGPKGVTAVQADWLDTEATLYAHQLRSVLTNAGFEVLPSTLQMLAIRVSGVAMFVRNMTTAPAHAVAIQRAFGTIGEYMEGQNVTPGSQLDRFMMGTNNGYLS